MQHETEVAGAASSKVTLIFPVKLGQLHNCCTAFEGSPLLPDLRKFRRFRKSGQSGIGEEVCASFQERNFPWGNKARLRKVHAMEGYEGVVETWVKFYLASNIIVFLADILFRMDFSSLYSMKLF